MPVRAVRVGCLRAIVLGLMGLGFVALGARPAAAMGCHVPDRPVLDLTTNREPGLRLDGLSSVEEPPAHQVGPRPCPGEVPERSVRPLSVLILTQWPSAVRWPDVVGGPAVVARPLEPPLRLPQRIDRPPRQFATQA